MKITQEMIDKDRQITEEIFLIREMDVWYSLEDLIIRLQAIRKYGKDVDIKLSQDKGADGYDTIVFHVRRRETDIEAKERLEGLYKIYEKYKKIFE